MDFSDHEDPDDDKPTESPTPRGGKPRYRECLKNHAVTIGGHAVDGCGEFMPAGEEGTIDSLRCAACNCHRNFHRKELPGSSSSSIIPFQDHNLQTQLPRSHQYYRTPARGYLHQQHHHHHQYGGAGGGVSHGYGGFRPPYHLSPAAPLALPSTSGGREDEEMSEDLPMDPLQEGRLSAAGGLGVLEGSSGGGGGGGKKRFRTKFTQEQKVRMLEFAEKVGWRIQKHDEAAVLDFCNETGVRRHVLKVWMHNNKHTLVEEEHKQHQPRSKWRCGDADGSEALMIGKKEGGPWKKSTSTLY